MLFDKRLLQLVCLALLARAGVAQEAQEPLAEESATTDVAKPTFTVSDPSDRTCSLSKTLVQSQPIFSYADNFCSLLV